MASVRACRLFPDPWGSCGNTEYGAPDILIQQVWAQGSAFLIRFPDGADGVDVAGLGSTF